MAKTKAADDGKSQRQKFIDAAIEVGATGDHAAFRRTVKQVASAPPQKAKKAAVKRKP